MEIIFSYSENKSVDYRKFTEWLFWGTPNLKKHEGNHAKTERVYSTIEVDLNVSRDVAKRLVNNAIKLGFIDQCGWANGLLSGYWCVGTGYFYPTIKKPA